MNVDMYVNVIFCLLGLVIICGIAVKFIFSCFGKAKEQQATVVNKQYYQSRLVRKAENSHDEDCYVVTFRTGEKELSFYVSEYSYNGYRINEKGILKYRGSRIIDFKRG